MHRPIRKTNILHYDSNSNGSGIRNFHYANCENFSARALFLTRSNLSIWFFQFFFHLAIWYRAMGQTQWQDISFYVFMPWQIDELVKQFSGWKIMRGHDFLPANILLYITCERCFALGSIVSFNRINFLFQSLWRQINFSLHKTLFTVFA